MTNTVRVADVVQLVRHDERDRTFKFLFNDLVSELQYYDIASVADAAGVNPQTLYNWINRTVKFPSTRTFFRVAQALGMKLTWQK